MKLFSFVFGQWDINLGNRLIQKTEGRYYLILIDNAGMYNRLQVRYGEYPFVLRAWRLNDYQEEIHPFPFDEPQELRNASCEDAKKLFRDFFEPEELERFCKRNCRRLRYCIWDNALWIQYFADNPGYTTSFVSECPQYALQAYKNLTSEILISFWKEAYESSQRIHIEKLMADTLERRDQLLSAQKVHDKAYLVIS